MAETEIIYSANDDRFVGHRGGSAATVLLLRLLAARLFPGF